MITRIVKKIKQPEGILELVRLGTPVRHLLKVTEYSMQTLSCSNKLRLLEVVFLMKSYKNMTIYIYIYIYV